jgi:hypothetical protein
MVRLCERAYGPVTVLVCDKCGGELPGGITATRSDECPSFEACRQLRKRSAAARWLYVTRGGLLVRDGAEADYCPCCFLLPPED